MDTKISSTDDERVWYPYPIPVSGVPGTFHLEDHSERLSLKGGSGDIVSGGWDPRKRERYQVLQLTQERLAWNLVTLILLRPACTYVIQ